MTDDFESTESYVKRKRVEAKADLEKIYDEGTPGDIAEWFMNHCKGYIGMLDAQTCVEILTEVDDETMEKNGG